MILKEAVARSAFAVLDGGMDGHDSLVVAALVPSIEEIADKILAEHGGDVEEGEALAIGFAIREALLEQLEKQLSRKGGEAE